MLSDRERKGLRNRLVAINRLALRVEKREIGLAKQEYMAGDISEETVQETISEASEMCFMTMQKTNNIMDRYKESRNETEEITSSDTASPSEG